MDLVYCSGIDCVRDVVIKTGGFLVGVWMGLMCFRMSVRGWYGSDRCSL